MNNDYLFKIFVINYYGNLPKILKDIDIDIQHNGLMMCPMHDNYNTPAAKIFKDETGWHFFCFNEQKQFGTYDVYKYVYGLNMNVVFNNLWSQLSQADKDMMKEMFGEIDEDIPLENIQTYQKFRYGQSTYQQLKNELCSQVSKEIS